MPEHVWFKQKHEDAVISATASTGYEYHRVHIGLLFLQPIQPEALAQTRSRSKSVAIETS